MLPCSSCHRDALCLRLAGISRPSLWWCDVCCQGLKALTHLHFTATGMFIASIRAEEKNDLFYLIYFFFLSGHLQFYFMLPFNRSQHGSSLETHHLRQETQWWPSLQSKDVTQISRKHKAQGLICARRESELSCAWWVALVSCVLQKASSALAIYLQGKSSLPATVPCQTAKGHGDSIVP